MSTSVRWTRLFPKIVLAGLVAFCFWKWSAASSSQLYAAGGVVAGVCATLLGFMIAAVAIITALVEKTLIANMRKTGHFRVLMRDTFLTCGFMLATMAVSCIALVVNDSLLKPVGTAIAFLLTLSLSYAFVSGRRFSMVVMAI
jgi:hypothetical protein